MATNAGRVTGLFIKPVRHAPMVETERLRTAERSGLIGDCHAHPLGPRQILVVRDEALRELGAAGWQVRANLVVAGLTDDDLGSGSVLGVGGAARVRITHECEICKVLRDYLDRETFRRLPGRRGSLGVILEGGEVAIGDTVTVEQGAYPVVPDAIGDRAAWIVSRVPEGRAVSYDALIQLIGGKRAHFRVLPTYLRRAEAAGLPSHRVLTSALRVTGHIADQEKRLRQEGVRLTADGALVDDRYLWTGAETYVCRHSAPHRR
jgi:MOSC domain-containing protein YiiM/alkylated DNA nucleotide flippase Atl1